MDLSVLKTAANVATRTVGRGLLQGRKHSPTILLATGIVGFVGTAVLASKATLKVEPIVDDTAEYLDIIDVGKRNGHLNELQRRRQQAYVLSRQGLKLLRLYGPTLSLGAFSVGCLISSHGILLRRNAALGAAYTALDRGFKEYRKRVADQFGEEEEKRIYHGTKIETYDIEGQSERGVKVVADSNQLSPYARFFDEFSPNWKRNADYNLLFLRSQQNYANHMLQSRGHVFLNEVYDMLGLPRSSAGSVVGWVLGGHGDSFVDFGIYDPTEQRRAFVNGAERSILLDFNVDGVIYDQI